MDAIQRSIHQTAQEKGWWASGRGIPEALALVHSEISEALECYRNGENISEIRIGEDGKPEGFAVELADAVIRILDLAEHLGIRMSHAIHIKMQYNRTRPHRHGGKVA